MSEKLTRPSIPELLAQMLMQNQDKNFVQRIMQPDLYPVLPDYAGPGTWGTHLMAGSNIGDKTITYPQIIQGPDGNLQRLDLKSALEYALQNNEYMKMNSPQEANWFGENYKKLWGW
jgi:hypothetical protein